MRIYNLDSDTKVNKIILYLTPNEAEEMKDSLAFLINNEKAHHEHIPDRESGFKREITICIYKEENPSAFDERSRKLIFRDE